MFGTRWQCYRPNRKHFGSQMVRTTVRIIVLFNIVCFLCFCCTSSPNWLASGLKKMAGNGIQIAKDSTGRILKNSKLFMKPDCQKDIVIFGMRPHWRQFCFEMFACKSLVEFPRHFRCPEMECSITLDYTEEARKIRNFDVVVFTNVYPWITDDMWDWLHSNRTHAQRWVIVSEESPINAGGFQLPEKYADVTFDWIASYKTDSEFRQPYGRYEPFPEDEIKSELDLEIYLKNKTNVVSWMGSNCDKRLQTVRELESMIQLKKYGKCGDFELPWEDYNALFNLLNTFKFYLSFENSCCDDYITEKFWRTLDMGVVPVVMGATAEQYANVAPPNSFIHVEEFTSLSELVNYLMEMNANNEKYLEYFQWKKTGKIISLSQQEQYIRPLKDSTYCSILKKYLHESPRNQRKIEYFGPQWVGSCRECPSLPTTS